MPKRYILFIAGAPLSATDLKGLKANLDKRFGGLKVIAVEKNPRAVIVRGEESSIRLLREDSGVTIPGGTRLETRLTSGAIGKLKKRAAEAALNGEIHE